MATTIVVASVQSKPSYMRRDEPVLQSALKANVELRDLFSCCLEPRLRLSHFVRKGREFLPQYVAVQALEWNLSTDFATRVLASVDALRTADDSETLYIPA
ncbi:hypothetical protein [Paraburkholderia sp. Cpub6]|uniref:hypothetical protein n=1 Tax=Paraburkholderia sp. Cpub6 TaxID=2723094 RepID=UPI00161D8159|nr:hypothetical protein [Paraburkholderia sp. Cpub6]MBB5460140.1 hypothetical protein [Paraburkholderia sp. Cpub6]